ncbi:MAG: adenosylmethionine-8-amino-7-oxononanoate aminotransferase [Sulfurovum sp. PC08-66]|nr:MAG: adenosylmethionine-8-amino-7-oxononanoate aminotransferase [Sulfurovum sp. PC08-66]KIM12381.1 MAG: adenosylmethionine-8-amino-7-oxononanoate aminotransferase [Sulfuricurvum sp. PC08-66]
MRNSDFIADDLAHIWHPCTQMKDFEFLPLTPIAKGEGVYLEDFEGHRFIDAISSWWVNIVGHSNPYVNAKIKAQLDTLEHVILAGFTHEPIVTLTKRLVALTPAPLQKAFFADNGSSAVEVALKMSYHYFKNRGQERSLFLSLTNSYHGETLGALSVGDVSLYKSTYAPLLIANIQTPVPRDATLDSAIEAAKALESILQARGSEIAALILEPLVQGAGSMHMYHPHYLVEARRLTQAYGVHLIADEIMTGFGRTGTMFACEQADISPDFMCLSKGLTGGYLPLSVVMTTDEVYSAFYCDYHEQKAFLHSHSYTGNPLACAAANATLEFLENEAILFKNREKIAYMAQKLAKFSQLAHVGNIRQTGMIAAFDIEGFAPQERIGLKVFTYALAQGVLLRPLGNVVYMMPPYVITTEQIDTMMDVAYEAVARLVP